MLDVCAELIDEIGYESTTTTLIARRAGVSVGSLYQFFPDKRAVVQALARRNMETFLTRLSVLLARRRLDRWWQALGPAVDLFAELHRDLPGFRVVRFGDAVDANLWAADRDSDDVLVQRMTELLRERFGEVPDEHMRVVLVILVKALDGVTRYAFRGAAGDGRVIAEAKILTSAYLGYHLRARGIGHAGAETVGVDRSPVPPWTGTVG